jgi:uncharacterized membrane protein YccC
LTYASVSPQADTNPHPAAIPHGRQARVLEDATMAALLLLLAIAGATVVGDLVLENTGIGTVTLLNQPITGYSEGLLLAMAAAIGFVVGLLMIGSVSMRRTRRARRRQLRVAERELNRQLAELERENTRLRDELARRDAAARRLAAVAAAADVGPPVAVERKVTSQPVDPRMEPVYAEARRAARLRSDAELSFSRDR